MPMRRQMQNKGELAVMVVCVVVGFLLAAQLRSVKLAGAADATNASRLETLQNLYNEVVDQKDGLADQVKQLQGELELYRSRPPPARRAARPSRPSWSNWRSPPDSPMWRAPASPSSWRTPVRLTLPETRPTTSSTTTTCSPSSMSCVPPGRRPSPSTESVFWPPARCAALARW